jgi:RND family efflux transporter MFP subunit
MASLYLEGVGASGTLTERALEENTSSEIAEVTAMQSNLKFAENQLVTINSQIDNSTLLSPINGRVLKLRKYNGEYISNTTGSLMSLGVVSPISSIFILGEKDSFSVHSGLKVTLETDLYKNREWKGVVRSILPLYQEKTFSSRIKADIENNDLALNPGVFFRGQIVLNKKVTRLLLPISTVFAGEYVFVYSNGRVNTKKIKYLNIDEQTIEVQSGLSESEEVVLSDKDSLREGMEVGKSQP